MELETSQVQVLADLEGEVSVLGARSALLRMVETAALAEDNLRVELEEPVGLAPTALQAHR